MGSARFRFLLIFELVAEKWGALDFVYDDLASGVEVGKDFQDIEGSEAFTLAGSMVSSDADFITGLALCSFMRRRKMFL